MSGVPLRRHADPEPAIAVDVLDADDADGRPVEQGVTVDEAETGQAPDESTETPWAELGFASAEDLAKAYRNLDTFRGRQANELGEARAQLALLEDGLPGNVQAALAQQELLPIVEEALAGQMPAILDAVAITREAGGRMIGRSPLARSVRRSTGCILRCLRSW
jgi:hypothetical protein